MRRSRILGQFFKIRYLGLGLGLLFKKNFRNFNIDKNTKKGHPNLVRWTRIRAQIFDFSNPKPGFRENFSEIFEIFFQNFKTSWKFQKNPSMGNSVRWSRIWHRFLKFPRPRPYFLEIFGIFRKIFRVFSSFKNHEMSEQKIWKNYYRYNTVWASFWLYMSTVSYTHLTLPTNREV